MRICHMTERTAHRNLKLLSVIILLVLLLCNCHVCAEGQSKWVFIYVNIACEKGERDMR